MVCGDCVSKLAFKLLRNHSKLDMIRAFELAEKAVERVENRTIIKKGNPSDYTQNCTLGTCAKDDSGCTEKGNYCTAHSHCVGGDCAVTGECGCPAPLEHSEKVSDCTVTCLPTGRCENCLIMAEICVPTCATTACTVGTCGYDCIPPYYWDGEACVLPVEKQPVGDGLTFAI